MNKSAANNIDFGVSELRYFVRVGLAYFSSTRTANANEKVTEQDWQSAVENMMDSLPTFTGPLGVLVHDFNLSAHDIFLLVLCGEVEANHSVALTVAKLQGESGNAHPQLHLASALTDTLFAREVGPLEFLAHPLVTAGILSVSDTASAAPFSTISMLPRLWSILTNGNAHWPGIRALEDHDAQLLPEESQRSLPAIAEQLRTGATTGLVLRGPVEIARTAASVIADCIGMLPVLCSAKTWDNDVALHAACRYGRWLPIVRLSLGPGERHRPAFVQLAHPVVYLLGRDGGVEQTNLAEYRIAPPNRFARTTLWREWTNSNKDAERLGHCASLDAATIKALGVSAQLAAEREGVEAGIEHLVAARRGQMAESLLRLAQPVTRQVERDALILPTSINDRFDNMIERCEQREAVWDGLGPALSGDQNLGVHALFVGPSGTGKTLAVSHLATRLGAPLYRLDLSAVMNKYVGETEKNLSAALDQAADLDVILLMDEADALFGRRGDGDGEGERFGNMLTNFLLTRIETHPGIVVLTSNSRSRIDPAFTRRLHAVIEFPEPGFDERLAIWQSHLGNRSPGIDGVRLLASLCDLAGGFVRTAVLSAAARSPMPPEGGVIPVSVLASETVAEYEKLGRTVPSGLIDLAR